MSRFNMFSAWGFESSKAFSMPETLVFGPTMPTFSPSSAQRTVMPLLRFEWQMFGTLPPPHPPEAMCEAQLRALFTRFEWTGSAFRPCAARKLLMPEASALSALFDGAVVFAARTFARTCAHPENDAAIAMIATMTKNFENRVALGKVELLP